MASTRVVEKDPQSSQMSASGCLVRLFWMLIGNVAFLVSVKVIAAHRGSFLSLADYVFWAVVIALVGLRYVDIAKLKGATATGTPATLTHWKRYSVILVIVAGVAWGLAHLWAANH